jgi:hypothetical protein
MGIVGNMDQYTQFQAANAIGDAARNPGGGAGEGLGLGMGIAMGQRMAQGLAPQGYQQQGQPQQGQPSGPPAGGPPPLPPQDQWFLGAGGQRLGPFDTDALAGQAQGGTLTPSTLVWKNGMAQWTPASQVPELAAILSSVPPPLPPQ